MPAIYIYKYNRFVDGVIARINKMLGKSYDPVRVKLDALEYKSKKTTVKATNKNHKKKGSKGSKKRKQQQQQPQQLQKKNKIGDNEKKIEEPMTNKMGEMTVAREENRIKNEENASRESSFVLISKTGPTLIEETKNLTSELRAASTNKQKTKKKTTSSGGATAGGGQKKKKKNKKNGTQVSRATLFGLSTIRRNGDVTVNVLKDRTLLKSNFLMGPLTLRVERETGKGARREVKSATATTAEMFGRLNMKIMHGGSATLQTIRVLQPKSVRVDSADNHDKTREYVWKRSANIATMVTRKLATVVKSLLKQ
ncbi:unnamed protein product [Phyllotreta striolata]|uniref:Uncharacterized protein n=1 Tax=Phyllotreta striolata TaxID=444603 RepID=A0A9N9TUE3_PHYSR|nr:unnamed protein product [Phyllotreta striolata]